MHPMDERQMEEYEARVGQEVRMRHPWGFRSNTGEWAKIVMVNPIPATTSGRICWLVEFADGVTDLWICGDPTALYEFRDAPVT